MKTSLSHESALSEREIIAVVEGYALRRGRVQGAVFGALLLAAISASAAAITFASAVIPLAAATDANYLCYHRKGPGDWEVTGPVCPKLDPLKVTGFQPAGCSNLTATIATPSGAVLTDLKAKFNLLAQLAPGACGVDPCPVAP